MILCKRVEAGLGNQTELEEKVAIGVISAVLLPGLQP